MNNSQIIPIKPAQTLADKYSNLAYSLAAVIEDESAPLPVLEACSKFVENIQALDQAGMSLQQAKAAEVRASLALYLAGADAADEERSKVRVHDAA